MKTYTVSLLAIAAITTTTNAWTDSEVYKTVLPSVEPTTTRDPWQCVVANLTQYFDVPKPTGGLLDALNSYGDKLIESCTKTGLDRLTGCFPAKEEWCKFTTAAPASVRPDYQLYGSAASAWWAGHSSSAVRLAQSCPNGWYDAMLEYPGGPTWLNETIIFAACHAEAVTTTTASGSISAPTGTNSIASTLPGVSGIPMASVTPAPTAKNGVAGRGEDLEMWMAAGTGFVAAAANSMWNGM
ncbi:hypothetical protein HYFRA_00006247 [Hymenoscyphus fraxineus]|uniref:DUF7735 domain-containing protein n=1 Tax=Hymenoscyphus fraxineus TaxID=746836 RepID=A0A9N9LDY7_9HELO|nr:hypothetical protein HYFRA_00006247 [Hymenoscyphus fraxineus]